MGVCGENGREMKTVRVGKMRSRDLVDYIEIEACRKGCASLSSRSSVSSFGILANAIRHGKVASRNSQEGGSGIIEHVVTKKGGG